MSVEAKPVWRRKQLNVIGWAAFDKYVLQLAAAVGAMTPAPEVIVGISRGGLIPAVAVAHALGDRRCYGMAVLRNASDARYSARGGPSLEWGPPAEAIARRAVVVIDDIAGDGGTLAFAADHLRSLGATSVRTATLVVNLGCVFPVDAYCVQVDDWVVFPWERSDEADGLRRRMLESA